MKQGWQIKKLGEVCESDLGKTLNQSKDTGELYPYLCAVNILWDKIDFSTVKQTRFEKSELERYSVHKGDLLICEGGDIGRAAIWKKDEPMLYQNALHRVRFNGSIIPRFCLLYLRFLKSIGMLDSQYGKGVTIKHLVKSSLLSIPIPVPPIAEQENIVAELDCLSGIIEKKKQQLKEYDALAQSIFYEMFGDPVDNEKGWEVNVIGNIANFYNGAAHEGEILENGKYHVVNSKFISSNGEVRKYCDLQIFPLYKNDIVMVMSDVPNGKALAKCYIIEDNDIYTLNQRICAFRNYELVPIFLYYCLNRNPYYLSFDNGNSQTNLRKKDVLNCPIIIPPLALQQEFASKIEAIEKQKALIKKSIEEVKTLFNSRMNEYFN